MMDDIVNAYKVELENFKDKIKNTNEENLMLNKKCEELKKDN
jgi:hypothetical protein